MARKATVSVTLTFPDDMTPQAAEKLLRIAINSGVMDMSETGDSDEDDCLSDIDRISIEVGDIKE